MKFPAEYTGLGMFCPQSAITWAPSSDATLAIKTRAPPREPLQLVCSFGSNVKLRKVNLIINPAGTVMVEVQNVFRGKLLGKFGLVRNPLVPARSSPHSPVEGGLVVTCIVGVGVAITDDEEGAGTNDDIGANVML